MGRLLMNELIRKLKNQSRDYYLNREDLDCNTRELHEMVEQKFADLIVEECILAIKSRAVETPMSEYYIKQIQKHFGVK